MGDVRFPLQNNAWQGAVAVAIYKVKFPFAKKEKGSNKSFCEESVYNLHS